MRANSLAWFKRFFGDTIARYREINDGTHISKTLGWFVIGFAVLYTSLVIMLPLLTSEGLPLLTILGLMLVIFWVLSFGARIRFADGGEAHEWCSVKRIFAFVALTYLVMAAFGWGASPDTKWQWRQVTGIDPFDDWHPVAHTALLYIGALVRKSLRVVVMEQVGIYALLIAWLYATLKRYNYDKHFAMAVVILAVANPFSTNILRYPWKDTAFAMLVLALTICQIHIIQTKGVWLKCTRVLGVALLVFLASFVRHNGFFYSLPLAVLLPIMISKQNRRNAWLCVALALVISVVYVAFRGYSLQNGIIDHRRENQGFTEAVGLPMCMMAESYVKHPEKTPAEVAEFLESLCDREFWEKHYDGTFNPVKFECGHQQNSTAPKISAVGAHRFFELFAATIKANPASAVKSFLYVTSQAWAPFPEKLPGLHAGEGCIANNLNFYQKLIVSIPLGATTVAPGFYMLCIIIVACYCMLKHGWRRCILAIPYICYQFGTMLLLTGFDHRFFYITVLNGGVICLMLLQPEKAEQEKRL